LRPYFIEIYRRDLRSAPRQFPSVAFFPFSIIAQRAVPPFLVCAYISIFLPTFHLFHLCGPLFANLFFLSMKPPNTLWFSFFFTSYFDRLPPPYDFKPLMLKEGFISHFVCSLEKLRSQTRSRPLCCETFGWIKEFFSQADNWFGVLRDSPMAASSPLFVIKIPPDKVDR